MVNFSFLTVFIPFISFITVLFVSLNEYTMYVGVAIFSIWQSNLVLIYLKRFSLLNLKKYFFG